VLLNPQVNTGVRLSSLRERAPDRRCALSAVGGGHHRDIATLSSRSNCSGRTMRARELDAWSWLAGCAASIRERIAQRRADGLSLRAIAAELNTDQVPTAQGGKAWHASTVKAVLES
jgi:Recombinase